MVVIKNKNDGMGFYIHMKCGLKSLVPELTIISFSLRFFFLHHIILLNSSFMLNSLSAREIRKEW